MYFHQCLLVVMRYMSTLGTSHCFGHGKPCKRVEYEAGRIRPKVFKQFYIDFSLSQQVMMKKWYCGPQEVEQGGQYLKLDCNVLQWLLQCTVLVCSVCSAPKESIKCRRESCVQGDCAYGSAQFTALQQVLEQYKECTLERSSAGAKLHNTCTCTLWGGCAG